MDALPDTVRRYADAHAGPAGAARTPIASLTIFCATAPSEIQYAISRPMICLVQQGTKQVAMGSQTFVFGAGDTLLITADVPTVSQVTQASIGAPYLSLVVDLDVALIAQLAIEMNAAPDEGGAAVQVERTDAEVAGTALRLMHLLDRPAAVPVLQTQMLRELHYWLLAGQHGPAMRRLAWPEGPVQRVARAVALLREDFAQPLPVERLAAAAGMSASSFHKHFRAVTSLSPVQFQKQLRLIEARRQLMSDGVTASTAAFAVGYESVSQFTREYRRMFGLPPRQDAQAARNGAVV